MKKVFIAGFVLVFAQLSWGGGPDYSVKVDVDICPGSINGIYNYRCTSTLSGLPAIDARSDRNALTSIRIPEFWDGGPVTLHFFFLGSETSETPGSDPEFRMTLSFSDPDGVLETEQFLTTVDFTPEMVDEIQSITVVVEGLSSDDIVPGKLYGLGVGWLTAEWFGLPTTVSGVTLDFPVTLPFIFENGFESGQAAYWSSVYGW